MAPSGELERGRTAYERAAWREAHDALAIADAKSPLTPEDLELLAVAAFMLALDDPYFEYLERAHRAYLDTDRPRQAAGCALWLGLTLMPRGEIAPALGWLGRAERLLADQPACAEKGYLLIPNLFAQAEAGDEEGALATTREMQEIGRRFDDPDLVTLGMHEEGQALVRLGRPEEGLRLIDECMAAVTAGDLSPRTRGIVYCNTIAFCQGVFQVRRAKEWTTALTRWCDRQPDMVAHTGVCLVHRAEIMQLEGAWQDSLAEASQACERLAGAFLSPDMVGRGHYQQAEIHRLLGAEAEAEAAYQEANRRGFEPQPGLALLRLAQGDASAAAGAIRRALSESSDPRRRAALLPAYVEIMLEFGDVAPAREGAEELERIAAETQTDLLAAAAAEARGAVALASGAPDEALGFLRKAVDGWTALDAPFEAARARIGLGLSCRALGDEDSAALELDNARHVLGQLGARPALARLEAGLGSPPPADTHGLTARELEVLRMVAGGATNKGIAAELVLSERTVDRHVSNIFAKLRVSSRSAATAFAYEHELL
jgi:DNA-binding NarL/FixJ family response regulator